MLAVCTTLEVGEVLSEGGFEREFVCGKIQDSAVFMTLREGG